MLSLNVGNTFDLNYLQEIVKLNQECKNIQVKEMYGSVSSILNSVRPNYRVPDRSKSFLAEYVALAWGAGIETNYTFNRSCFGHIKNIWDSRIAIQKDIDYLTEIGVKRFTVASPLLIEFFRFPKIELSTILVQLTIKQIYGLAKLSDTIDKVCVPIYLNRDFTRLLRIKKLLEDSDIKIELIVNEFCVAESGICVRRDECYNTQSHDGNPEKCFDNYPAGQCIKAREHDPVNWLRAPFILPQDMTVYNKMGIEYFKVTGRTHSSDSIFKVVSAYMKQSFNGSLCELWGIPLERIYNELGYHPIDIPVKYLGRFLEMWLVTPEHRCMDEVCGIDCNYCRDVYNIVAKEVEHDKKRADENPEWKDKELS